jgi:hypothetical protein
MQSLSTACTVYYNLRHTRHGHLLDGHGPHEGIGKGYNNYGSCSGGGHGGMGGKDWRLEDRGIAYGLTDAPVAPGSGGGGGEATYTGGAGGGAVRIEAPGGTVSINGIVTASGASGSGSGGGGSGGSICISCGTFSDSNNGILRANGGDSSGGGGGGGRIAVQYATMSNASGIQFSTEPGSGAYQGGEWWWYGAGMGTLYLSDATLLSETLTDNLFTDVRLTIDGFSSWAVDSLTVSNCSVELAESGFQLTVSGDLTVGTNGAFGVGAELGSANVELSCANIVLTDGGSLSVYSGPTNGTPDYGALVVVDGNVVVDPDSWIYPYSHNENGGSVLFQMQNLLISVGGGIDAIGRGFAQGKGPGKGVSASRASGGAYGGIGGNSQTYTGGQPYGSINAPIDPGRQWRRRIFFCGRKRRWRRADRSCRRCDASWHDHGQWR